MQLSPTALIQKGNDPPRDNAVHAYYVAVIAPRAIFAISLLNYQKIDSGAVVLKDRPFHSGDLHDYPAQYGFTGHSPGVSSCPHYYPAASNSRHSLLNSGVAPAVGHADESSYDETENDTRSYKAFRSFPWNRPRTLQEDVERA